MKTKANVAIMTGITIAVTIVTLLAISGFSTFSLFLTLVVFLFALGEFALLFFIRRVVLYRKQNIFALISIAFLGLVAVVAIADLGYGDYTLPSLSSWLGLILFLSGNYLLMMSLIAVPRHCKEEYEEEEPEKHMISMHGPYEVVRHPVNLAGILIAFSIPLALGSAWALIASASASAFIIVHAVIIENYRFENYKWYYEYTKEVPFMLIPVIW